MMFDTTIFNRILDGKFDRSELSDDVELYITHVQRDEIAATSDSNRKIQLLEVLANIVPESMPTESAVWDYSNWDEAKFGDDSNDSLYDRILGELRRLDPSPKKDASHIRDTLIAETAIKNEMTLVSADQNLIKVVKDLGGKIHVVK